MEKEKIRNLDDIIKEIENCEFIDCHKNEIFDDYQYENILYYLKQLKKQKEIIEKAIEYINKMFDTGFYNDDYYLGKLKEILEDEGE